MFQRKMADSSLALVHEEWLTLLGNHFREFDTKLSKSHNFTPKRDEVFRNFRLPLSSTKVLILGQDPYPTKGAANGLAFSTNQAKLPKSLKNIFIELYDDCGGSLRTNGDLSDWHEQGVALLNTILTTEVGHSLAHQNFGWELFAEKVISLYAQNDVVALLMGKSAAKYSEIFKHSIVTPHPSPLSAYRGFFGSKPFSRINEKLESQKNSPIKW